MPLAPQEIRTFFITAATWGRRPIFRAVPMAQLFLDTLQRYRGARDFLVGALNALPGVEAPAPEGAMYVFFRVAGISDSLDFCKQLVREARLGLAPGSAFGPEGNGFVRWCFAASEDRLADGVRRLGAFLRR